MLISFLLKYDAHQLKSSNNDQLDQRRQLPRLFCHSQGRSKVRKLNKASNFYRKLFERFVSLFILLACCVIKASANVDSVRVGNFDRQKEVTKSGQDFQIISLRLEYLESTYTSWLMILLATFALAGN